MDGVDSEFPSPRTPTRDRQGLALSGHDASSLVRGIVAAYICPQLLIYVRGCLLVYMYVCVYTCTHTYIYMHTNIYKSIVLPAIRHLPTCDTVGASQLPAQTLKLRNHKSIFKLGIFQQPGNQDQVVPIAGSR